MPKKKESFIDWRDDWRNCRAKMRLIRDIDKGRISLSSSAMPAEVVHRLHPVYEEVEFQKFKRNLESLRKAVSKQQDRAFRDNEGLTRDKELRSNLPAAQLDDGKMEWNGSAAQARLCDDIQQSRHLSMQPKELWQSHPEYQNVDLKTF
jgi:hypothetical protein